jgi:anti-sigma factor RsiW
MTCADAGERIDAFVDGELPPSVSVEVARHLSGCARCDGAAQAMLGVREALVAESDRALAGMDLSAVWPGVAQAIDRTQAQMAWRERAASRRRVPRGIGWGAVAAIAAGTMLFFRPVGPSKPLQLAKDTSPAAAARMAGKRLPNHVYIDRLAGKDIALRREPKSGTTMIWVNHEVESSGW